MKCNPLHGRTKRARIVSATALFILIILATLVLVPTFALCQELVHAEMEGDLSLEELADAAGLSIAHFSQMFRESTGQSPHQFVLHRRADLAKEMLRAAEMRVLDVAVACGFKTQQHFARVFRRVCGASPTEYRQEFVQRDQPPAIG